MRTRELTEKQQLFLEVLFGPEARGDVVKAKILAGYSETYSTSTLVKSLEEEIIEATKKYLSRKGPRAVYEMGDILDNPTQLGVQNKIAVAKDILDRAGIVKTERIEVNNGVFILPAKKEEENA
jgi:hypothetical protein